MDESIHTSNVVENATGLIHAPYANMALFYDTYTTACFEYIDVGHLRATTNIPTCLGCIARSKR